jgi:hypothetical protein
MMARATTLALDITPDALESLRALGELGARLGGPYEAAGEIIAERLDAIPGARLALREPEMSARLPPWPESHGTEHAIAIVGAIGGPETANWVRGMAEQIDPVGQRDAAVREAIGLWPEMKLTPACQRLSDELDRYITSPAWLGHERHIAILPPDAEERRRLLHRIARLTGKDGSLGARQIFNLMKSNPLPIS